MAPCLLRDQCPVPTAYTQPQMACPHSRQHLRVIGRLWCLLDSLRCLELNKFLKNTGAVRIGKCTVRRQLIRSLVLTLINASHVYVQAVLWESNGYVVKKSSDWSTL